MIASCSSIPQITTNVMMPSKYDEPTKLRRIAVIPFDGYHGNEISKAIESDIASVRVGEDLFYTVVERDKIDQVIKESLISSSAVIDENTVVEVGNILGVEAIYMGQVNTPETYDRDFTESRSRCAYYKTEYTKKGKAYEVCAQTTSYTVDCKKRTAKFAITPKIIDIKTGQIIYANTIQKESQQSWCSDSGQSISSAELVSLAQTATLREFRQNIAPYFEKIDIQLMTTKAGMTRATKSKFDSGLNYAEAGRIDRACQIWNTLPESENSSSLVYSQGVCQEITGNFSNALIKYKKSDEIFGKPNEIILNAISRAETQIKNRKKLQKQTKESNL